MSDDDLLDVTKDTVLESDMTDAFLKITDAGEAVLIDRRLAELEALHIIFSESSRFMTCRLPELDESSGCSVFSEIGDILLGELSNGICSMIASCLQFVCCAAWALANICFAEW